MSRHRKRRALAALLVLAALAVGVRALIPVLLERYVTNVLNRSERYEGRVADVDVALLRGGYVIEGLVLDRAGKDGLQPLLRAKRTDLTLRWKALLRGALVGEVVADGVRYEVVASPPSADEDLAQSGADASLGERLSELFPFSIDRLEVRDGELRYSDPHRSPPVDVALRRGHLLATNWSNVHDSGSDRYGRARLLAEAFGSAPFYAALEADPLASPPDFRFAAYCEGVDLTALNDFLRAYGGFDAEQGRLSVYTEVSSRDGSFSGYVKPLISDLEVLGSENEDWSQWLWNGVVGVLAEAFENQFSGRQASRIPLEGQWGDTSPDMLTAIGNVLYNAFIQSLPPRLEHPERLARGGDEE